MKNELCKTEHSETKRNGTEMIKIEKEKERERENVHNSHIHTRRCFESQFIQAPKWPNEYANRAITTSLPTSNHIFLCVELKI